MELAKPKAATRHGESASLRGNSRGRHFDLELDFQTFSHLCTLRLSRDVSDERGTDTPTVCTVYRRTLVRVQYMYDNFIRFREHSTLTYTYDIEVRTT